MSDIPSTVNPLYPALYFSAILSVGFYGVTCMQTFFYFIHYQDDKLRTKTFVVTLWALNTVHEALIISGVYKYIMSGLVDPSSIANIVQELVWQFLFLTLIMVPTQGFFIHRIYLFSDKNIMIPLIWLPLGLWELVESLIYVIKGVHTTTVVTLGDAFFTGIGVAYYAVAAAVDISIALCLTYLLARRRKQIASGFKNSAKVLQILTVFAVNTGIWTAIFALLTVIPMPPYPIQLTYVVFGFPLCSIYCNTLLANINARTYVKDQLFTTNTGADLISDTRVLSTQNNAGRTGQRSGLKFFTSTPGETDNSIGMTCTTEVPQSSNAPAL